MFLNLGNNVAAIRIAAQRLIPKIRALQKMIQISQEQDTDKMVDVPVAKILRLEKGGT